MFFFIVFGVYTEYKSIVFKSVSKTSQSPYYLTVFKLLCRKLQYYAILLLYVSH